MLLKLDYRTKLSIVLHVHCSLKAVIICRTIASNFQILTAGVIYITGNVAIMHE